MTTRRTPAGDARDWRKPREELRPWATYATAGEYWEDHQGYVPIQMMVGISRVMRERGVTFPEAFALLLAAGAIIELDAHE